jgi:acetyl-CoA carboxylase carboxyltransferase component
MSWEEEIEELRHRRELARRMGGPDNIERQHKAGRLTVRERIEQLLDGDSFSETGSLAGKATYQDGKLESPSGGRYRGRVQARAGRRA